MKSKKNKDKEVLIKSLCKTYNQLRKQEESETKCFETLKSIEALLKRSITHNPSLCYNLGLAYYEGWKGVKDPDMALHYFQKAAKGNYPPADFYIGIIFMERKEYKKSVPYYKKSLTVNPLASYNLGVYYEDGMGVKRDLKEAVKYYKLAVKGDYPLAFHNLATFYRRGMGGLKQDYKKAMSLYKKTIKMQDDPLSYHALAQMYFNGFGVKQNKKRALELLRTAIEKGGREAKHFLGLYYYNKWVYGGNTYISDKEKGLQLIHESAYGGYIPAVLWMAFRNVLYGLKANVSIEHEVKQIEEGLNIGEPRPESYIYLGYLYQHGYGVVKDIKKAKSMLLSGIHYEYNRGAIEDPEVFLYLSKQFSGNGIFQKNPQREEEYRCRWLDYYRGSDYIGRSRFHEPIIKNEFV